MSRITIFIVLVAMPFVLIAQKKETPNILVRFGVDIGIWNISHIINDMMGIRRQIQIE